MLGRWAKRRHPKKSRSRTVKKYWHSQGTQNWVFSTKKTKLKLFSDTRIVRHTSLKLNMNPYLDKEYFDVRRYKLRARKIAGKPKTSGIKMNNCSFCMNSVVSKPYSYWIVNCCPIRVMKGLSRMWLKSQVRFLEEGERVITHSYSAKIKIEQLNKYKIRT